MNKRKVKKTKQQTNIVSKENKKKIKIKNKNPELLISHVFYATFNYLFMYFSHTYL